MLLGLGAAALVVGLAAELLLYQPRRPRPEGWRAPWDGLALLKEGEWATDPLKRGVVQGEFFSASDQLEHCVRKYEGNEGQVLVLELLVETERGGTHFEFVDADAHPVLSKQFVACVTGVLERAVPLPTPGLPVGTRWRLQVHFLVPPAQPAHGPWWKRLLPGGGPTRPGNDIG